MEEDCKNEDKPLKPLNFHEMEIDDRILKAIALLGWISPTLIQEKAIPLLLEGKDVLLRARTGSGKTAAFGIPVIQKILNSKASATVQKIGAIILAPSKELSHQIKQVIDKLTIKCSLVVRCIDLSQNVNMAAQKHLLSEKPDIIISTPSRMLLNLQAENLNLKEGLEVLVIDEADLLFSFGYEHDLKNILNYLPAIHQSILASATLDEKVLDLKTLILHNPFILKLQESDLAPLSQLTHYHISAEEEDKATILYSLLKLNLVRGKTILFVNTVDKCYKLKLFLEQFAIRTCVLNSELPSSIRVHAVQQFNQGKYDIIIASDERSLENPQKKASNKIISLPMKRSHDYKESSVARGIDFQCVSNVINFDFPFDINSYIHRSGRTARGNNSGNVLSFVNLKEKIRLQETEKYLKKGYTTDDSVFKNYQFKLDEVEAFRYRGRDAWRAITRIAIKEARLNEIKVEMFNSKKLKTFFEDNPRDLAVLRHDKLFHTIKIQEHLSTLPEYCVPETLKGMSGIVAEPKIKKVINNESKAQKIYKSKLSNPLLCDIDFKKKRKFNHKKQNKKT